MRRPGYEASKYARSILNCTYLGWDAANVEARSPQSKILLHTHRLEEERERSDLTVGEVSPSGEDGICLPKTFF